jgi:uncharacterized protein (DUF736 family)
MSDYDNTNSGALFKNERKETEKHPDYTGQLNVNGVDHWVSAWIKKSKTGKTFMSLSIKPKDLEASKPALVAAGVVAPLDDEIPW